MTTSEILDTVEAVETDIQYRIVSRRRWTPFSLGGRVLYWANTTS